MLFLMRSKLQIVWDLTFNSAYKLIILSTYFYSNQSLPSFFYPLYLLLEIRGEGKKSGDKKSRDQKQHFTSNGSGRWAFLSSDTISNM